MKQQDIDKRIGMPDVDKEWARFERGVIDQKTTSRKPLYWGIGIAASILGISTATVNKHITRSLTKIRQSLKIAK